MLLTCNILANRSHYPLLVVQDLPLNSLSYHPLTRELMTLNVVETIQSLGKVSLWTLLLITSNTSIHSFVRCTYTR